MIVVDETVNALGLRNTSLYTPLTTVMAMVMVMVINSAYTGPLPRHL